MFRAYVTTLTNSVIAVLWAVCLPTRYGRVDEGRLDSVFTKPCRDSVES